MRVKIDFILPREVGASRPFLRGVAQCFLKIRARGRSVNPPLRIVPGIDLDVGIQSGFTEASGQIANDAAPKDCPTEKLAVSG